MGQPLKLPGGQRVGQRELDDDHTGLIRDERRQEESRFCQVPPRWRRRVGRGCRRWPAKRAAAIAIRFKRVCLAQRSTASKVERQRRILCRSIYRHGSGCRKHHTTAHAAHAAEEPVATEAVSPRCGKLRQQRRQPDLNHLLLKVPGAGQLMKREPDVGKRRR